MQASLTQPNHPLLCLRLAERALSIAHTDGVQEPSIHFADYALKSGIDQASQVKAILDSPETVPANCHEATLLVDSEVMLVPDDEYEASSIAEVYDRTITGHAGQEKLSAQQIGRAHV